MKKTVIFALNVNNFGGDTAFKPRGVGRAELLWFQNDPERVATAQQLAARIRENTPDIIILTEYDIASPASAVFLGHFPDYLPLVPQTHLAGKSLSRAEDYSRGHSITLLLISKKWARGKTLYQQPAPGNWADFNVVEVGDITLLAVHAKERNWKDLAAFVQTASRRRDQLIIIGDFNTHKTNTRSPLTSSLFQEILDLGYEDVCPPGVATFVGGTPIDHALIHAFMAASASIDHSFMKGLSDHAAILMQCQCDVAGLSFDTAV